MKFFMDQRFDSPKSGNERKLAKITQSAKIIAILLKIMTESLLSAVVHHKKLKIGMSRFRGTFMPPMSGGVIKFLSYSGAPSSKFCMNWVVVLAKVHLSERLNMSFCP